MEPAASFLSLPEDIQQHLWSFFDAKSLAFVVCLDSWAQKRSKTRCDAVWERLARSLVDFNSLLASETDEFDKLAQNRQDSITAYGKLVPLGYWKMVELARARIEDLKRTGQLKPFSDFRKGLKFQGHFESSVFLRSASAGVISWKAVYIALQHFLDPEIQASWMGDKKETDGLLLEVLACGEIKKVTVAAQALLTGDFETRCAWRDAPTCEESIAPLFLELIATERPWNPRHYVSNFLKRTASPTVLLHILDHEFEANNNEERSERGLRRSTEEFFLKFGLQKSFEALLNYHGAAGIAFSPQDTFDDKLVNLVQVNRQEITEAFRGLCVHLLCLNGSLDRVVHDLLQLEKISSLLEESIVRTIVYQKSEETTQILVALVMDSSKPPRARIRAAWILCEQRYDVQSLNLRDLGMAGFPRPWTCQVEIPVDLRTAILRRYGSKRAEQGSDLALLVEAELCGAREAADAEEAAAEAQSREWRYKREPERVKTTSLANGIILRGPISATDYHQAGGGPFNVYEILVDPFDAEDDGVTPCIGILSTCVMYTCTFAPYAWILRRFDEYVRSYDQAKSLTEDEVRKYKLDVEEQLLPSFDRAQESLMAWATEAGFQVVEDDLLDTPFDGLNVYFFGRRAPLRIRDLLFYWQD